MSEKKNDIITNDPGVTTEGSSDKYNDAAYHESQTEVVREEDFATRNGLNLRSFGRRKFPVAKPLNSHPWLSNPACVEQVLVTSPSTRP
jgi:hypothetical protein